MKRLLNLLVGVSLLVGALAFAPAASASDNGTCVTDPGTHWLAGEQPNQKVKRIKVHIDVNGSANLCGPGENAGDGTFHYITLTRLFDDPDHTKAQLAIGIAKCRSATVGFPFGDNYCEGPYNDPYSRVFINNVSCVEPLALDRQYDMGPADESGQDLEIAWDPANNEWDFYGDGGAYLKSFRVSDPDYECMDPEDKGSTPQTNGEMTGGWYSERFDLGDGWGEVTRTQYSNMYYMVPGTSTYITAGDGSGCDGNNHDYTPHRQYCYQSTSTNSTTMQVWTVY